MMFKAGDTVKVLKGSLQGLTVKLTASAYTDRLLVEGFTERADYGRPEYVLFPVWAKSGLGIGAEPYGTTPSIEKIDELKDQFDKENQEVVRLLKAFKHSVETTDYNKRIVLHILLKNMGYTLSSAERQRIIDEFL